MRILNITNINYKGIKVINDRYATNPKNNSNNAFVVNNTYERMSDTFEAANDITKKINLVTKEEKFSEIDSEYEQNYGAQYAKIYDGHTKSFFTPIRNYKMRKVQKELEEQRSRKKEAVEPNELIGVKNQSVEKLEEVFYDGVKKVQEYDNSLQKNAVAGIALENNDKSLTQKTRVRDGFSKIAGYQKEKEVLDNVFVSRVLSEKEGEKIDIPGSILFFGPYNNGKTYTTKNVAQEAGCKIAQIRSRKPDDFMEKLYKQAELSQKHFDETKERTIIFLDEADMVLNSKNPRIKEFEEFLETCSDKYHCSVFAATNNPSWLGVDLDNPDVFPIRMSIDAADDENLKAVMDYYLGDILDDDVDYDTIVEALRTEEKNRKGRYTNAQFAAFSPALISKYSSDKITQNQLLEFIKSDEKCLKPMLSNEKLAVFDEEYNKIMG